jgi:hypothetical protein
MIDCRKCKFYFITWRKKFPHGCRAMGFMSLEFPSSFVKKVSGEPCLMFEQKVFRKRAQEC